jgi:NAD(P)-dependent dehydrogenase (short-subunit alcohol dehydrogenase family)
MFKNKFDLTNKKILITGASSGIGAATAKLLSFLNSDLVLTGRDDVKLSETIKSLKTSNNCIKILGDLKDEIFIKNLIESIDRPLDGLVISAGIVKTKPLKFYNKEDFQEIMSINFELPILLCTKLLKAKKINKGSSIVFISSIAGNYVADIGNGIYSASKGALNGIQKVMCLELAPQKIRVNSICPGMVKTPLIQENLSAVNTEQLKKNELLYPLGYGEAEDVAYGAAFLLSDASRWISGTSIVMDGGFSIS